MFQKGANLATMLVVSRYNYPVYYEGKCEKLARLLRGTEGKSSYTQTTMHFISLMDTTTYGLASTALLKNASLI